MGVALVWIIFPVFLGIIAAAAAAKLTDEHYKVCLLPYQLICNVLSISYVVFVKQLSFTVMCIFFFPA
jgi:hypothetical protein